MNDQRQANLQEVMSHSATASSVVRLKGDRSNIRQVRIVLEAQLIRQGLFKAMTCETYSQWLVHEYLTHIEKLEQSESELDIVLAQFGGRKPDMKMPQEGP